MKYSKSVFTILILFTGFIIITNNSVSAQIINSQTQLADYISDTLYSVPKIYAVPEKGVDNIKAIFYQGLSYKGKETRVFAYIGIPKTTDSKKVPGMVLVHGGGGTAFAEWVKIWNDRGYAAIAMDLEGHMPDDNNKKIDHKFSGPERNDMFNDANQQLKNQWMFHAIADIMLANSLLAAQPEVDSTRIGITGISWGGILSSLVSGIDKRFKCAIPVYGCGYLYESESNFKKVNTSDSVLFMQKKFWDPANYFKNTKIPVLWVNDDCDAHFSINITTHSFETIKNNSTLSIHPGMKHSHHAGYSPESVPEIYDFTDNLLMKKGEPLAVITKEPSGLDIEMDYKSKVPIISAKVYYITSPLYYVDYSKLGNTWKSIDAILDTTNDKVTATMPENTYAYYVNITDDRNCIISSTLWSRDKSK